MWGGGMGWGMGWGWLFWLLLVAGVIALVVVLVRVVGGGVTRDGTGAAPAERSARQVLDERYARGELSTEEYQERRRGLGE